MNTVYVVEWIFEGYWLPLYASLSQEDAEEWLEGNGTFSEKEYRIVEYTRPREYALWD